jgi:hypothetical protein
MDLEIDRENFNFLDGEVVLTSEDKFSINLGVIHIREPEVCITAGVCIATI